MTIEYYNDGITYAIPEKLCDINLFHIDGQCLEISTGVKIQFSNETIAEEAWWIVEQCLRKGGNNLFLAEEADGLTYLY